jgi:hypothetical protein
MRSLDKKTLLLNATSQSPGAEFNVERNRGFTFVITTTVQGAATVDIEAWIGGAYHAIHSEDVSSVGSIMIRDDMGHYEKIRANISAYTAGTHSVYATGTVESL